MKHLAVVGAGSWGTALATVLAARFETVRLWARSASAAADMRRLRENGRYLPGVILPAAVSVSADLPVTLREADVVLLAVPSAYLRGVLETARPLMPSKALIVSAVKGIEEERLSRMSQVVNSVLGSRTSAMSVLSGPTFAREVAAGEPAAMAIASESAAWAEEIQKAFSSSTFRLYTTTDVVGVEIGAALKNVIAIAAGICSGLGLGGNSVAALVTRGLAEITRLAVTLGGNPRTLSGLAGLGDLVLTATGDLSRNRLVGQQLGKGRNLKDVLAEMTMVAEGVGTCRAAYQLGRKYRVEMPITNAMYQILYEGKDPRGAIRELMERPLTSE